VYIYLHGPEVDPISPPEPSRAALERGSVALNALEALEYTTKNER